jgi:hypothetical protein
MKGFAAAIALVAVAFGVGTSCQAQFFKNLEQSLLNGSQNQQGGMPGQQTQSLIGNVSLPPGQYMMQNLQGGQPFYVLVQNGQMYLNTSPSNSPYPLGGVQQPGMFQQQQPLQQPGQSGGFGGMLQNGLGNFLKKEIAPGQQQQQQYVPNQ